MERYRILIVEDDPLSTDILAELLGGTCTLATAASEADRP